MVDPSLTSARPCLELLSSHLLQRLFADSSQLLEILRGKLSTARSLQKSLDSIISESHCTEAERIKLQFILLLHRLSGYSVPIVVFCLFEKQLDGVASGSVKSQKTLVENVATIPVASKAVPIDSAAAWLQLRRRLFALEPTSFLCGLARSGVLPSPSEQQAAFVAMLSIASENFGFDISKEPIHNILDQQQVQGSDKTNLLIAAKVPRTQWPIFREHLLRLQRLQSLVSEPEDIDSLWRCGYRSSDDLVKQGSSVVEAIMQRGVPRDRAEKIYNHATVVAIRNEGILTAALSARGINRNSGSSLLAATGASKGLSARSTAVSGGNDQEPSLAPDLNFTAMFGMESMGCEECGSATGPCAYFVDFLQALKGIKVPDGSTLLDKLLARRPDLGNLQLSCANTEVLIPYIDLVNEMLESVLWHLSQVGTTDPGPDAFNMDDNSTSEECIAQPRNVDFLVYSKIIQPMVYPMPVFPYNQAINSTRAFLQALGSSRFHYLSMLRSVHLISSSTSMAQDVLDRALAAEALGLQHEDFVAICGEGLYSLDMLRRGDITIDKSKYNSLIGLKSISEYWGYVDDKKMVAADRGLTLIKEQLLPRSGLDFQDLLSILSSRFMMQAKCTANRPDMGAKLVLCD